MVDTWKPAYAGSPVNTAAAELAHAVREAMYANCAVWGDLDAYATDDTFDHIGHRQYNAYRAIGDADPIATMRSWADEYIAERIAVEMADTCPAADIAHDLCRMIGRINRAISGPDADAAATMMRDAAQLVAWAAADGDAPGQHHAAGYAAAADDIWSIYYEKENA